MPFRASILLIVAMCVLVSRADGDDVTVADDAALRAALRSAEPGTTIRIAPGVYRGGIYFQRSGTVDQPIVIEAADPADPPVFQGGGTAIQLGGCSYVTLRNLRSRGQTANGFNCDDAGRMDGSARGIVLEGLRVEDVGPRGNIDAIKLSGLTDFRVSDCVVEGWGGSGIDMVGCHNGLIERCTFRGKEGFSQSNGIQAKGGSADIRITACDFIRAGQRAINCGGSTGMAYFRPQDATWEAKAITIDNCRFVGAVAAVGFVGVDGATFTSNTIYHPEKWIFRILQETTADRFAPCRNVRIERNLIVFRSADVRTHINIGPNTAPQTFIFSRNWWYCDDAPAQSRPTLPTRETDGIVGRDPGIALDESGLPVIPSDAPAAGYGAARAGDRTTETRR